jgi:thymidylate kinase
MFKRFALEGVDGCGKSTVWNSLKERYKTWNIVFTEELKTNVPNNNHPEMLMAFLKHREGVLKRLKKMYINTSVNVVQDRSVLSSAVYQGFDNHKHWYKYILESQKQYIPECVVIFELPISQHHERFEQSGKENMSVDQILELKNRYKFLGSYLRQHYNTEVYHLNVDQIPVEKLTQRIEKDMFEFFNRT